MQPTPELQQFIQRVKPIFWAAAGFSLVINLLMLVPSLYMLQVYDRVLTSRNTDTLLMLTLLAFGMYLVLAFNEWIRTQLLINAGIQLDAALSPRLFESFITSYGSARGGQAGSAFADASNVRQFLTGNGLFALFDAPWAPIFLVVIYLMHPALGAVSLVGALLLVALAWWGERITHQPLAHAGVLQHAVGQAALSHARNHEAILSMGMMRALQARWLAQQTEMVNTQAMASRRAGALAAASRVIRLTQQMAILGVGALLVVKGEVTPGAMIAASILMGRALAPLDLAISAWRQFFSSRDAYRRIDRLLQLSPAQPETLALPTPTGEVSVEGLTLVPPGAAQPALYGVAFQIRKGMAVGVIGPSGSGKSCLARALTGIWTPLQGSVRLDGALITDWDKSRLGPHIGYLPQSIELFDGTVAENIARFGPLDAEAIVASAQLAGIHELILRLPKGYETPIGTDGWTLSGGQRQRIALARAVYGSPKLVVLDEPNSNLDDQGEQALLNALQTLKRQGTTVVVITHRRGILAATEGLVVLQEGRLQVYGPTSQVLQQLAPPVVPAITPVQAA